MQSILEALYYGNLCPSEKPPIPVRTPKKTRPLTIISPCNWSNRSTEKKRNCL